jgi:hypothetical protein
MDPSVERPGSRVHSAADSDSIACHDLLERRTGVKVVVRSPGPDFRPHPHPTRAGEWIALTARIVPRDSPGPGEGKIDQDQNRIEVRTAPHLAGPWTLDAEYSFPEVVADQKLTKKQNVFAATLAEHPQFRVPGWLVASYSCRFGLQALGDQPEDCLNVKTITLRYG